MLSIRKTVLRTSNTSRLRTLSLLLGFAAAALSQPAVAQGAPRSVSDCERLKNDLAYNQCLAMFGPAAKNVTGGDSGGSASVAAALAAIPSGAAAAALPVADEPAQEIGRRGRRGRYTRGGRQSATFSTGGGRHSYRRHRRR